MITKKEACRIATSESGHSYIEEIRETETGYILYFTDEYGYSLEQSPVFVSKADGHYEVFNVADRMDELRKSKKVTYIPVEFMPPRNPEQVEEAKRRAEFAYNATPDELDAAVAKIVSEQRRRKR